MMSTESFCRALVCAAVCALLVSRNAFGQEIPPKSLLDVTAVDAPARFGTSSDQLTLRRALEPVAAVAVKVEPGTDPYPGIRLKPQDADRWDFSSYGHVEVRVTNTGKDVLCVNLRVDNEPGNEPDAWNAELVNIGPGKTATLRTIFGHSYGYKPAYKLKADAVTGILIFTNTSDSQLSYRIESIQVGGPPNEKPSARTIERIRPADGVILGPGSAFDPTKQLEATGGATASVDAGKIRASLPPRRDDSERRILLRPANGFWHLGDANELRVTIRNTGDTDLAPVIKAESAEASTDAHPAKVIPAHATAEIVVPFAQSVPWRGVPPTQRKGNDGIEGTGTRYASDKTDAITISAASDTTATFEVESVIAACATTDLPDWVGKRPPVEGDWVLTFNDDFEGDSLDLSKWNNEGPNHWDKVTHWSKQNVRVSDGTVSMVYEKKTGTQNDDPNGKRTELASGFMDTLDRFRQRYGYFEARVKLPKASGLWPAFWMMPDRGPNAGDAPGSRKKRHSTSNGGMEFDIMEHLAVWGTNRYNIAVHWDDYGPDHKHLGTGKIYVKPDAEGYITSGLLWLPGKAIFYCQGQEVGRWEDERVSSVPSYMMFTLPSGGWDGNVLDESQLPDAFVIDYVRAWQRRDLASNESEAETAGPATK